MKLQTVECPNCKAPIEPFTDARFMFCPYCGTKIIIDDIEVYKENSKTEREHIRANRDILKAEIDNRLELERLKAKTNNDYMSTILIIVSFVVVIILCALLVYIT